MAVEEKKIIRGVAREKQRGDNAELFTFWLYGEGNHKNKVEAMASYWKELKDGTEVKVSGYGDSEGVMHAEDIKPIQTHETAVFQPMSSRKLILRILLGVAAFSLAVAVIGFSLQPNNNYVANNMIYMFIVALVAWIVSIVFWRKKS